MTTRRAAFASALVAAGAMVLLASGAAPSATSGHHCNIDRRVLEASYGVIVFRKGGRDDYNVFACAQRNGRVRRIGTYAGSGSSGQGGPYGFDATGLYLAYIVQFCLGEGPCGGRPHVRNVLTNSERDGSPTPEGGYDRPPVALPEGAMAWIRQRHNGTNEVHVVDRHGERVLDASPDVEPASIARSGGTIYWLHDGQPRTARPQ